MDAPQSILSLLIPIIATVMGLAIPMLAIWVDYRKRSAFLEQLHRERLAMLEKGLELPPFPPELLTGSSRCRNPLKTALTWTLIGAAVSAGLYQADPQQWAWGLVPMAVGVANGLYWLFTRRSTPTPNA